MTKPNPCPAKGHCVGPKQQGAARELVAAHIAAGRNRDAEIEWRGVKAWGVPPTEADIEGWRCYTRLKKTNCAFDRPL